MRSLRIVLRITQLFLNLSVVLDVWYLNNISNLICISSQIHVRGKLRLIGSTFAMLCVFFWCCLCGSYNGNREGGKKGRTRFTGTVFQLSVLGELSVLGKLSILGDTTANKILCFDFPQSHPGFCETVCFFYVFRNDYHWSRMDTNMCIYCRIS